VQLIRLFAFPLLLTAILGGCSSSAPSNDAACRSVCTSTCKAFADCSLGVANSATCVDGCVAGIDPKSCASARPADQLTCEELKQVYDCSVYCAALCQRAPECGTFDQSFCLRGCTNGDPPICNAASVAARTCDQLKPELREDEERGRALSSENSVFIGGSSDPKVFGLCKTGIDCDLPLGCSAATNTCAPCSSDSECFQDFGKYSCSPKGECVKVDCLTDTDCFNDFCDTQLHTCIDCRTDADCKYGYHACSPTSKCVWCTRDEHCTSPLPICDATAFQCVECLTDADCTEGRHCGLALHFCE